MMPAVCSDVCSIKCCPWSAVQGAHVCTSQCISRRWTCSRLPACVLLYSTQVEAIVSSTHELKERQETPDPPEALACVPTLKLSDIPREVSKVGW
jgi:hypothetical protein